MGQGEAGRSVTTGAQIRAARRLLRWQYRTLAARSELDSAVVVEVECLVGVAPAKFEAAISSMRRALEAEGIEFLADGGVAKPRAEKPMITGTQIIAARKLLGWSAATLAKRSGKRLLSVAQAERGTIPKRLEIGILQSIQQAIETAGIELVAEPSGVKPRRAD